MLHGQAVKIIEEGSGTHFDPKLVKIFLKIFNETDLWLPEHA